MKAIAQRALLAFLLLAAEIFVTAALGQDLSTISEKIRKLSEEAASAYQAADYENATSFGARAAKLAVENFSEDDPGRIKIESDLARYANSSGRVDVAEEIYRRILTHSRKAFGEKSGQTIEIMSRLGALLRKKGAMDEAEDMTRAALEGKRGTLGGRHPSTLYSLNDLGALLLARGRLPEAAAAFREAMEGRREVLGDRNLLTLRSMNNLGDTLVDMGRPFEAEPLLQEALDGRRAVLGDRHPTTLNSLNNFGKLLAAMGRYEEAETYLRKALADHREVLGDRDIQTLICMNNLSALLDTMDRPTAAEPLVREAHAGFRAVLGEDHRFTIGSASNLANLLQETGRFSEAEPLTRDVLARHRSVFGDRDPHTLNSLNSLAVLLHVTGKLTEAEAPFREALAGRRAVLGERHPETLRSALNFANFLQDVGRVEEATSLLAEVAPGALSWVQSQLAESEAPKSRRLLAGDPGDFQSYAFGITLADKGIAARRLAAQVVLGWKGADGADEAAVTRFVANANDEEAAALAVQLASQRKDLATAINQQAVDIPQRAEALAATRAALTEKSREFASVERERRAGVNEVQAALRPGEVLLAFRAFWPVDFKTYEFADWWLLGVLIRPGEEPLLEDLGPMAQIAADIAAATAFEGPQADWKAAAARLSERLLTPFGDALAQAQRVYVSPDGSLNLLPFDILPFDGQGHWIEAQDVRLVSTGRALVRKRESGRNEGLLAVGGVDFEEVATGGGSTAAVVDAQQARAAAVTRASGLESFVSLPSSGPEIEEISALFAKWTGQRAKLLSGASAREAALKSAETPRVLHVASHGFFRKDDGRSQVDPMTLSGLALAGANKGLKGESDGDGEDGILWALEAMSLPLQGTELVTLSACDTAKGVLDDGEGVYGLGRAFQIAGAENVLLTLWPLADEEARWFMVEFYEAWLSGEHGDPAAALRATKLAWLGSADPFRSDPEFWAPYVLVQNGR